MNHIGYIDGNCKQRHSNSSCLFSAAECQANLVNFVPFHITSYVYYQNHIANYLFPSWEHEDRNLSFFRDQSKYITLLEAKLILERAASRTYCITAVTKRIIRYNLGLKSGGKMSQWLVDKEAFEKFVNLERGGQ